MNQERLARALTPSEFDTLAKPLRQRVFVQEQGIDPAIEWDGKDGECRQYGLWQGDTFIATARVSPTGKLGRMAVAASHRRQGCGADLVKAIIEAESAAGLKALYLHAQADAVSFYRAIGFREEGDAFQEAGIEHQAMKLFLGGSQPI